MSAAPKELYVSVELYLSKSAVASTRKPALTRRKTDKRESIRALTSSNDVNQRKVKEKSSWLNLSRNSGGSEQWRAATCKLVEEDGNCLFRVYLDETILYQSVHIKTLNHTDIRHVHRSLFGRGDCLGIFCSIGQSWSPTSNTEPLYLHFSDTELMNAWLALLRSNATPEVYGRIFSPPNDGGLYRMWRQVKLTCLQGRNLGSARPFPEDPQNGDFDNRPDGDVIDIDVYCEVYVNGCLSGRTTVKKGIGSPDWHESFTFSDLPPFENLEIVILREKKLVKPSVIGNVLIFLNNFRRGEHVEGWFPVLTGHGQAGVQVGDMRLQLRVDEEIILPYTCYSKLLKRLQYRNYLDWLTDLDNKLKLKSLSDHIMSIALADHHLVRNMMELAEREVEGTPTSDTLFRGNTVFSKTMEIFMASCGASFLEASVGSVIRRLCSEGVAIEVDPVRSGGNTRTIDRNVDLLVHWCREFWTSIYDARTQCPSEMRQLFAHIRMLVETRCRINPNDAQNRELPWQSVSSFLFLRFIVPAILHPHLFGIWPGLTEEPVQRSLKLIAKVLQSLANLNTTVQKEEFMRAVKDFLSSSSDAMIDYLLMVSSPDNHQDGSLSSTSGKEGREKIRITNALHQRLLHSPSLYREAIPILPHLLDVPKHLAVVTSVVVRHSRRHGYPSRSIPHAEQYFNDFCSTCLDVEEQALFRVSQLASSPKTRHQRPPAPMSPTSPAHTPSTPSSPSFKSPPRERKISLPGKTRRTRRLGRPSTAPSPSDSETRSNSQDYHTDVSVPPSPVTPSSNSITRIFSRTSISSRQSTSQITVLSSTEDPVSSQQPRSMPRPSPPRPPFLHHPRSTSTDSALMKKNLTSLSSPTVSLVTTSPAQSSEPLSPMLEGSTDELGKKRKGMLQGILKRR